MSLLNEGENCAHFSTEMHFCPHKDPKLYQRFKMEDCLHMSEETSSHDAKKRTCTCCVAIASMGNMNQKRVQTVIKNFLLTLHLSKTPSIPNTIACNITHTNKHTHTKQGFFGGWVEEFHHINKSENSPLSSNVKILLTQIFVTNESHKLLTTQQVVHKKPVLIRIFNQSSDHHNLLFH